jgi:dienelactone hydrolase
VIAMAAVLGSVEGVDPRRVGVRGSSLGGFLAITAAAASAEIAGVIAICPPSEEHLARGLRRGNLEMRVGDSLAMEAWLMAQDIGGAVERIAPRPLILMHAEGDTQVPTRRSSTNERASRASSSSCQVARTRRCNTMPSSRGWRCAGWSGSSPDANRLASAA